MANTKQLFFLVLSFVGLSGCTWWNAGCKLNWYELGLQDGLQGIEPTHVEEYRGLCLDKPAKPDYEAYNSGHWDGLNDFCTAETGLDFGRNEQAFPEVCDHPQYDFVLGFEKGLEIIPLEAEAAEIETEIYALKEKQLETSSKMPEQKRTEARIQFLERELERVQSLIRAKEAVHYLREY